VLSGKPVTVDVVEGQDAGLETDILVGVTRSVLDAYAAGNVAQRAAVSAGLGLERVPDVVDRVRAGAAGISFTEGTTSSEQLSGAGSLVAGQAGLFLLFTVGFGVLGLVYERDQGTLTRLRSMPMRPGMVVVAKALVSFILGTFATGVLLAVGSLLFGASFGSPAAVAVLVVAAVAAATSVMFVIVRVARTAEQANIAHSITAIALGVLGGAFAPILATGWLATLLDLNPVAALSHGLGVTAGGGGVADLGQPLLHLLSFGVVMIGLSRVLPDRGTSP
jgi:ABC-2 type transport system permease protein